jgi:hypothetical protein
MGLAPPIPARWPAIGRRARVDRHWSEHVVRAKMNECGRPFGPPDEFTGGGAMAVKQRDRIVIESEKIGRPTREGEILEVIEASYGTRYRVAWDDGHESTIRPAAGSARIVHAKAKTAPHR